MKALTFELYNDPKLCYPGSAMAGQLVFVTTKNIACKKITIVPDGIAKVFFFFSMDHGPARGYSNEEKYFNDCSITVFQAKNSDEILTAGTYKFPFRFIFPSNCLPTFMDPKKKAKVKYSLMATVHIRRGFNLKATQELIVCPLLDLNSMNYLLRPIVMRSCKTDLQVNVKLPRSGFYEGEKINIQFEICNETLYDVKRIVIGIEYNGSFTGFPTTQTPTYAMKDYSVGKIHKFSLPLTVLAGRSCTFQQMYEIKTDNNPTIDCSFLKMKFSLYVKIYCKNRPNPLMFSHEIQVSKVVIQPKIGILEAAELDPIFRSFEPKLPRQISLDSHHAFNHGPFPVQNNLMVLMERAEQNFPITDL